MRRFRPRVVLAAVVLGVLTGALWALPSGSYLLLPDRAKPLAGQVSIPGERGDAKGGIYYVDVIVRKASLLERLVPPLRGDGSTLVPEHAILPPGSNESQRRQQNLRVMSVSQQVAAAVALRELGYEVVTRKVGVLVANVAPDAPATGKLAPGDVVVEVDGEPVATPTALRRAISTREPGDSVRLGVRAGKAVRQVNLTTIADPDDPGRAIVGIAVEQSVQITLPLDVKIDLGSVGGPSAGLAFALDVMEELGPSVDGGYRVAVTGELELDGAVGQIGGVKQKTIGARRTGVDVFLVPAGDNAAEARRYAGGLRIIPVKSFRQALRALATLPPKN